MIGPFGYLRQSFASQFEPEGDGFIYRPSLRSPGYRVTAAERDAMTAAFLRSAPWVVAVGVLAPIVLIPGAYALYAAGGARPPEPVVVAIVTASVAINVAGAWWLWRAPFQRLRGRAPAAPALSGAEARRRAFAQMGWSRVAVPMFIGLLLARGAVSGGLSPGLSRIYLAAAVAALAIGLWIAVNKWRSRGSPPDERR